MSRLSAAAHPALRPVRADDRDAMRDFLSALSVDSRRLRFHGSVNPRSERLLQGLTRTDGVQWGAWVAVLSCDGGEVIVGDACWVRRGTGCAEFGLVVADAWQGRGVAAALLQALQREAAAAGIGTLQGDVRVDNHRMAAFMGRQGFEPGEVCDDGVQVWRRHGARPAAVPAWRWPRWLARMATTLSIGPAGGRRLGTRAGSDGLLSLKVP